MSDFRPRKQNELDKLDDDGLIAHIVEARDAGDLDAAKAALAVLVFRRYPNVERRCRIKLPESDAEDVAMNAMESAIKSAFEGTSVGEFVVWLNRIVSRRIADYFRRKEARAEEEALAEEHPDDEGIWGDQAHTPDATGEVDAQSIVDQAYGELSEPHQLVVNLYIFEDRGGQDTADAVNDAFPDLDPPMTDQNVQQVASRFRKRVRELLEEAEEAGEAGDDEDEDGREP